MNAVEIEVAISELVEQPFDKEAFPFEFLRAFGNKETTIKKLQRGTSNRSDVGGVLQTNHIHIAIAEPGDVGNALAQLRESPATKKAKAKFILATDGETFEAEELETGCQIEFAHTSFKWKNLAKNNAGVTVAIIGISTSPKSPRRLFSIDKDCVSIERKCNEINAYLVAAQNLNIKPLTHSIVGLSKMQFGNHPYYGGSLIFSLDEAKAMIHAAPSAANYLRPLFGGKEFISGFPRACLWIIDDQSDKALNIPSIREKIEAVAIARKKAKNDKAAQKLADTPWRFRDQETPERHTLLMPRISSESREYLPIGVVSKDAIAQDQALVLYDAPLWNMALIASRIHLIWIGTVCGKMKTDFRYSNTLGWNTFPVPRLTEKNKADLTRCAEDILLAREAHFPATIADLYKPDAMPQDLRAAHERNDEVLERIYIGRRFRNDTERLEKLFELYTKITAETAADTTGKKSKRGRS